MRLKQFVFIPTIIALVVGCGESKKNVPMDNRPIEYKLASLNKGGYISDNDITVARFKTLLEMLLKRFPEESPTGISDGIVVAGQILERNGISETLLDICQSINRITVKNGAGIKYNEVASAYVTFRRNGNNSGESIRLASAIFCSIRDK